MLGRLLGSPAVLGVTVTGGTLALIAVGQQVTCNVARAAVRTRSRHTTVSFFATFEVVLALVLAQVGVLYQPSSDLCNLLCSDATEKAAQFA